MMSIVKQKCVGVLGATGYVGGRLVAQLCELGYRVRAIGRSVEKMRDRSWSHFEGVELVSADVFDEESLERSLDGVGAVYYLVHSMNASEADYQASDRVAAENMCRASEKAGVERIIYLSGLGDEDDQLSKHLRSRTEVGDVLRAGRVPVTILRAAMVIGSGSASFEILRYLVDRLPFMITPKWVSTPNQPIAIRNVLNYLTGCLEHAETVGEVFDIGGDGIMTYRELMNTYAEEAGLGKRIMLPVPVLTPRLSSYWIHLITPINAYIARPLAEGLKNPVVCKDNRIREIIPQDLLSPREAIGLAIKRLSENAVPTHWADAGKMPPFELATKGDPDWAGGTVYTDERSLVFEGDKSRLWAAVESIGGETGWYHANFLWVLRGFIDRMVGGIGLRRGRRDQKHLSVGDAVDFWRVVLLEKVRRLVLVAEMKLPGDATLEFRIDEDDAGEVKLRQIARFRPKGLFGICYWFSIIPLHSYVFGGMIRKIVARAKQID